MATGRDVADRAGTSTAVVSYVFNNGPRNVAPATRERVLKAAAELNYQPNALARALSFGKTSSIGLIVPDIANRFFGELARALEESAAQRGNLLLIGDSGLDPERERSHISAFVERRVDSVVLVSVMDEPDLTPFTRGEVPVVTLHPVDPGQGVSSISIDYVAAAETATRHLISHGYRSIALFNGPGDSAGSRQHLDGFNAAVDSSPETISTIHLRSQIARGHAAQVALDALARTDRPRAVYCSTDEQAYGVLFACNRLGLTVPDDVAVTGFDGTDHSAYSMPPLTTIRQPVPEMAERAIELLTAGGLGAPVHESAQFELVLRESCGPHEPSAASLNRHSS
ncbi:LacI family DNA-binding transcriptional regulator [Microbacterium sp. RU33B]|uniref:LacI family DNA-binding transcriptional regulator n=1 Tax=Microbacterium sp. RU33B TaxID=1907390 RepID=UPI00096A12D4|nr:LacI family DNA-binding transcriptional regulator [Microbacterium sp. RU33B]SIT68154.1 transcriptional regulator, LacI family [Microbacterium sp. RU33B]